MWLIDIHSETLRYFAWHWESLLVFNTSKMYDLRCVHHWENSFRHCGKWLKACRIMQGKYRLSAEVCRSRIRSSYLMKCRNFRDADDNEHDDWELILRNLYWNADYRFASNRINYHRAKQLPRNVRANCSTKSFRWYRYICSKRWRRAT